MFPDRRNAIAATAPAPSRAARHTGAPVALVVLADADRQVFAGQVGLGEPWTTSHSFCQ